jgi:carbamoyl-phosphate synthase large subunit
VADRDKRSIIFPVAHLVALGFRILATEGTAAVLRRNGIPAQVVRKASERRGPGGEPTVVDLIREGGIDIVINPPNGQGARVDGYEIRTATTASDKAIVTTVAQLNAAVQAIETLSEPFSVTSMQEYHGRMAR